MDCMLVSLLCVKMYKKGLYIRLLLYLDIQAVVNVIIEQCFLS